MMGERRVGRGRMREGRRGRCRGKGALLVGFRSEGADPKRAEGRFSKDGGLVDGWWRGGGGGLAQGPRMLGREGVTGIDRVCNLGTRKGDRGRARNLGFLHTVPECFCEGEGERRR